MRIVAATWGLVLALVVGCARDPDPPVPVELQVGERRLWVVVPDGWEHLDYGDRHHLRQGIARIAIVEIEVLETSILRGLGETEQREVASRRRQRVGDHEAEIVDTWDRLSHAHRKRFFFLPGDGPRLAIYTMMGEFEVVQPAFDALVASVALVGSTEGVAGGAEASSQ